MRASGRAIYRSAVVLDHVVESCVTFAPAPAPAADVGDVPSGLHHVRGIAGTHQVELLLTVFVCCDCRLQGPRGQLVLLCVLLFQPLHMEVCVSHLSSQGGELSRYSTGAMHVRTPHELDRFGPHIKGIMHHIENGLADKVFIVPSQRAYRRLQQALLSRRGFSAVS